MSAREASSFGYVCKRCGGPAPVGVGYVSYDAGARGASQGLLSCGCGYSVHGDPVAAVHFLAGLDPVGFAPRCGCGWSGAPITDARARGGVPSDRAFDLAEIAHGRHVESVRGAS